MALAFIADGKLYTLYKNVFIHEKINDDVDGEIGEVFTMNYFHQEEDDVWTKKNPTMFVVDNDGNIWSKGSMSNLTTWTKVKTSENFIMMACCEKLTAAIDFYGYLWTCGPDLKFTKMGGKKNFVDVSAGRDFFVAIDKDGDIWKFGTTNYESYIRSAPVHKLMLFCEGNFESVSCGGNHALCLSEDGDVWGFGQNVASQLGFLYEEVKHVPNVTQVSKGAKVKTIAAGLRHTVCLLENGKVFACGDNERKQLGPDEREIVGGEFLQIVAGDQENFSQIFASGYYTLLKDTTGQLWMAGSTADGQFIKVQTQEPFVIENAKSLDLPNLTSTERHNRFNFIEYPFTP